MELDPLPSQAGHRETEQNVFHIGTFPPKKKSKKKPKKRGNYVMSEVHPGIMDRFSRVMASVCSGQPIDLGPPLPGTLRILVPTYTSTDYGSIPHGEWLLRTIHSHDRTLPEWQKVIQQHKEPIFQTHGAYKPKVDPFAYRKEHAEEMERVVQQNLRIRRFFRFWLSSARKRIMDKRIVGDVDLYTMNPIPEHSLIKVYDVPTRTTYVFHVHTILRTFLSSLTYNSFGIANPHMPKNPYTNVPWTIGQLIRIVEQCILYKVRTHSFLPFLVQMFRESGYDIKRMYTNNTSSLNIAAAKSYFANHVDPDVIEMYLEVYDDLESLIPENKGMWLVIKRKLEFRTLSKELLKQWDIMIVTYWIFHTYRYVLSTRMKTIHEIDDELITLYNNTCDWWSKQPKRSIRKRVSPPRTSTSDPSTSETITHV